jgi:hypothetical protein
LSDILIIAQILTYEHGGVGLRGWTGLAVYIGLLSYLLSGVLPLGALQLLQVQV